MRFRPVEYVFNVLASNLKLVAIPHGRLEQNANRIGKSVFGGKKEKFFQAKFSLYRCMRRLFNLPYFSSFIFEMSKNLKHSPAISVSFKNILNVLVSDCILALKKNSKRVTNLLFLK